jgi:hypothetical protein
MKWTRPLSLALVALVALLALAAAVEVGRTTLADADLAVVSGAVLALLVVVVAVATVLGAKNRRWLSNPDSYW